MHQHYEWRSTNIDPFKLVPNPKRDYLPLGDFRGLQRANLELCSMKSLLTAHLAPDDWNSSGAFLFSLKTPWSTPSGSSVHSKLPMKRSHNSSSPVCNPGGRQKLGWVVPTALKIAWSSIYPWRISSMLSHRQEFYKPPALLLSVSMLQEKNIWICWIHAKLEEETYVWQGHKENKGVGGYLVSLR